MIDTDDPDIAPETTAKLVRAYERAQARLRPVAGIVAPLAKARPDAVVPADLLALARQALSAIGPVAGALGAARPLPLHPPVTNAGLAARLALAQQQASAFHSRYYAYDDDADDFVWHVPEWLERYTKGPRVADEPEDAWAGFR